MSDFDEMMRRGGRALRDEAVMPLDVDADLVATLDRSADPTTWTSSASTSAGGRTKRWAIVASVLVAAGLSAAVLIVASGDGDRATISPVTAVPAPDPSPEPSPATDPADSAPTASTSNAEVASPDTTTPVTTALPPAMTTDPADCLARLDPGEAAERFADLFVGSRVLGDFEVVAHCVSDVPATYDGDGPACWTTCVNPPQFLGPATTSEGFDPNTGETIRTSRIPVQYFLDDGDETMDVVETWRLIRLEDGTYRADDFRIESPIVARDRSAETIRTYLAHLESGAWEEAAAMLDDGAIDLEERDDVQRLAPDDFELVTIAAALEAWCADGCDTDPFDDADLTFDGSNYRLERRGERISISWFEGEYSIFGLPIRTGEPIDPADFRARAAEILDDGTIERDEYVEAFEFLAACANSRGANLDVSRTDPSGTRLLWAVPGEFGAAYDVCYPAVQQIDAEYQTAERTTARIDAFYEDQLDCLRQRGVDVDERAQRVLDESEAAFDDTSLEPRTLDELDPQDLAGYAGFPAPDDTPDTLRAIFTCRPWPV